jgi:peroxiredoxin
LQSNYSRIKQQNAEILAVSMDDFQGAGTMIGNSGATFPVLYTSKSEKVPSDYGVYALHDDGVAAPSVFIIDKNGKIAYEYVGKDITDRPDTGTILEELKRLEAG